MDKKDVNIINVSAKNWKRFSGWRTSDKPFKRAIPVEKK